MPDYDRSNGWTQTTIDLADQKANREIAEANADGDYDRAFELRMKRDDDMTIPCHTNDGSLQEGTSLVEAQYPGERIKKMQEF